MLPFALPGRGGLLLSAVVFGLSFFVAPTAVALYTTAFTLGQTLGPIDAGWLADAGGSLSASLWAGAAALLVGGMPGFFQRAVSAPGGAEG